MQKEEIKEIFNYFIKYANIEDSIKISKLEDYITNLQESDNDKQLEIMKLKDKLEQQRKEYQETYKDVRIEIKEKNETITNLQEENEKIKKYYNVNVNRYEDLLIKYNTIKRWYQLNKSRCEKAIEYCNLYTRLSAKDLLDILQGVDKE